MPVKIRLRRMGAKHQPSYRIIVADSRSPRNGRYLDQVGFYNPLTNPATITVNSEKAIDWLRRGAQPTETVEILFKKFDIDPVAVRKGQGSTAQGTVSQGPAPRNTESPAAPAPVAAAPAETTITLAPEEAEQITEGAE